MTTNNIQAILEKFYRGETSLDEEKSLAAFFEQENLPESFAADKKLFAALRQDVTETPVGLSAKIETLIDSFETEKTEKKATRVRPIYWAMGVAASLALVFGVSQFSNHQKSEQPLLADTYKNPDDAYQATLNALQLFSHNFSKGSQSIEKANSHLEKTQKIVNQSIK